MVQSAPEDRKEIGDTNLRVSNVPGHEITDGEHVRQRY